MATAEVQCRIFSGQLRPLARRPARSKGGRPRVPCASLLTKCTRPCCDQRLGESLNLRTERARQTSGRHLQQAAPLDQGAKDARLPQDAQVALGVGEDRRQAGGVQFGQQPLQRDIDFVRQFEEHVAAAVGQREDFAAADFRQQVGLDPHVGPRQHAQRQPPSIENLLEASRGGADRLAASSSA